MVKLRYNPNDAIVLISHHANCKHFDRNCVIMEDNANSNALGNACTNALEVTHINVLM